MVFLKEPVHVNIELPKGNKKIIKSIKVRITNVATMSDLLKQSIDVFNDMFTSQCLQYQLRTDLFEYSFKPSKKSGKPDHDLPSTSYLFRNKP